MHHARPTKLRNAALFAVAAGTIAAGAMAGCSSGSSSSSSSPDSGTSSSSGGSSGASSSGGSSGDAGYDAGTVKAGSVSVSQMLLAPSSYYHTIMASFGAGPASGGSSSCQTTTQGACSVVTCPVTDAGTTDAGIADAGKAKAPNAGVITVSGGKLSSPLTLTPDSATGTYPLAAASGQVFAGGDTLSISAAGADVPAFQTSASAPGDITVTAPSFTGTPKATTFPKSSDLTVTWTGGASGKVLVSLSSVDTSKIVSANCSFDAAGGTGTVPSAVLDKLGATGEMGITPAQSKTVTAGDYSVFYTLTATGASGSYTAN